MAETAKESRDAEVNDTLSVDSSDLEEHQGNRSEVRPSSCLPSQTVLKHSLSKALSITTPVL